MPVPGTLKKRPFDQHEVARLLKAQFSLPENEAMVYLKLVETHEMGLEGIAAHMGMSMNEIASITKSMLDRGLIIEAPGRPSTFIALHPRMMLTNLFKTYEKEVVGALRERRATVDKVVVLLTPVFEEREVRKESA